MKPAGLDAFRGRSGIYRLTNRITGKSYIGHSSDLAKRGHAHLRLLRNGKHENKQISASVFVDGPSAFNFYILEFCAPADLIGREQFWIDKIGLPNLYNLSPFADSPRGIKRSAETCLKMSESKRGWRPSEIQRKRQSEFMRGRKMPPRSQQFRDRVSLAKRGRPLSELARARALLATKGKPLSAQHRAKLSIAAKMRWARSNG